MRNVSAEREEEMAKAEDLTGRRFGNLKVLERAQNRNGRVCWLCRCDCGNEKVVSAHDLKAGKCKTCGGRSHRISTNMIDLTGKKFGRLTVQYPIKRRDKRGCVYWHCICECGRETDLSENDLRHGNYQSCGCLRKALQKELPKQLTMVDGTCIEMLESRKYRKDNKSGFRGVYQMKNQKYRVSIGFKGKRYYVGTYKDYDEAVRARLAAEETVFSGFLREYQSWKEKADDDPGWAQSHPLVYEVEKINGSLTVRTS